MKRGKTLRGETGAEMKGAKPVQGEAGASKKAGVPLWALVLAASVMWACFFGHLDAMGLVGPDEPRYAAVARTMAVTGDWVTPRLDGEVWFEKPVGYYWAAAVTMKIFGEGEFAARLPSALAAMLAMLMAGLAAWRWYGAETGLLTMLAGPTCVAWIGFSRAASPDMIFSALVVVAVVIAAEIVRGEENSGGLGVRVLFGAVLGAAVLAKGPAAVVLVGGGAALWAVGTRRWGAAVRLLHWAGVGAFFAVAAPWYVLCAMRNPEFVQVFLVSHNVERFFTPVFQHIQPWWFFGMVVVLGLAPWTVLGGGAVRDGVAAMRAGEWRSSPGLFAAGFVIFTVVFFSLSKSKLPGYVLPVFPFLVMAGARSLARATMAKETAARVLGAGVGLTIVALAISGKAWLGKLPEGVLPGGENWGMWLVFVAAAGAAIALVGAMRWSLAAVVGAALVMAGLVESVNQRVIPRLDGRLSTRATARLVGTEPEIAGAVKAYRLDRSWRHGLNYYMRRPLAEWKPETREAAWVLMPESEIDSVREAGMGMLVGARVSREAVLVRVVPIEGSEQ